MIITNKSLTESNIMYLDLFKDLNLEQYDYELSFGYGEDYINRISLNDVEEILFYDDFLIIRNMDDDRYLYQYHKMSNIKIKNLLEVGFF